MVAGGAGVGGVAAAGEVEVWNRLVELGLGGGAPPRFFPELMVKRESVQKREGIKEGELGLPASWEGRDLKEISGVW